MSAVPLVQYRPFYRMGQINSLQNLQSAVHLILSEYRARALGHDGIYTSNEARRLDPYAAE